VFSEVQFQAESKTFYMVILSAAKNLAFPETLARPFTEPALSKILHFAKSILSNFGILRFTQDDKRKDPFRT
jgi:hypothetical protein